MEFVNEHVGTVLSLVLCVAAIILFLRLSQRNLRAAAARLKHADQFKPDEINLGHNLDAPAPLSQAEVQMHDLVRDMSAQLDSKIAIANQLLRRLEAQSARLEQLLGQAERTASSTAAPPKLGQ